MRPDQTVELPQRTFDLLLLFLREPHALHTRADLFQRVWPGVIVEDANLSQSVWVLRKALGPERKDWIRTVAKGGYVFEPPTEIVAVEPGGPPLSLMPPAEAAGPAIPPAPVQAGGHGDETLPLESPGPTAVPPAELAARMPPPVALARPEGSVPPLPMDETLGAPRHAPPSVPAPPTHPRRRGWMAATALSLAGLVAAASWFGNLPFKRATATTNVVLIEVQPHGDEAQRQSWRTALLHAWLDWKLRTVPSVNVLREENLAAESSPARPNVVLLATGTSPENPGDVYVRASFDGLGGGGNVQLKGPAADLPKLVDAVSREVMRRLMPSRVDDAWPSLALDLQAARRFADTFKALERRDWIAAQAAAQEVIQRAPSFAIARLQLAAALGRLGQAGPAIDQFATARAVLKPLPADASQVIDAQRLALDPRRLGEAAEAMGALAKAYPDRRGFLLDQAKLLARLGLLDQARGILSRPDWQQQDIGMRINQLLSLADLQLQVGDPQQARVNAALAQKLALAAGSGWQIEHAMGLTIEAQGHVDQYEAKADLAKFEQAAREFEAAGDEIDALHARFLATAARPPGTPGASATLEALLQKARSGGYRRLEIDILRRAAFQHYVAGNMPEYRSRLMQALTAANAAGDVIAQQHLDLDLLNEDMAVGDLASAEQRLKRLNGTAMRGERAFWVAQFAAQLQFLRGEYASALGTLERVVAAERARHAPLPPIAQARVACSQADMLLAQGHTAQARERYATCGKVDHAITRLMADLGTALLEATMQPPGGGLAYLQPVVDKINAMPNGPDRWWPAVAVATALTRGGQPDRAEAIYRQIEPGARQANYGVLVRMVQVGLAEVAAARGDWATSRKHAAVARTDLPADDWFSQNRLAELDIGYTLSMGNAEAAMRQLARLDAKAHALGDAVVQNEVHSLMPPGAVVDRCTEATRAALARRTGMRGATLAWMAPRSDLAPGAIKVANTRAAR